MQVWTEEPGLTRASHFAWEMKEARSMCLNCGFMPIEGMIGFLRIHGDTAQCVRCDHPLPSVEEL